MSQLQRLVESHQILSLFNLHRVTFSLSLLELTTPDLDEILVLISSVSEISDCIYVERVLPHADCITLQLYLTLMYCSVYILTILLNTLLNLLLLSQCVNCNTLCFLFIFIHQLVFQVLILSSTQWEVLTLPLPVEVSLALILFLVEDAASADLLIDYSHRLKSIGQNDIGIHSSHVYVIDEWLTLVERTLSLDVLQPLNDLLLDLVKVSNQLLVNLQFYLKSKVHDLLHIVYQVLVTLTL
jgi:hypothetical protein